MIVAVEDRDSAGDFGDMDGSFLTDSGADRDAVEGRISSSGPTQEEIESN
jgi:hypothetical protein